jgi:hypothetical protein
MMDDLKISHVSTEVMSSVIEMLEAEFGCEAPLTVHCRQLHDYLGMTLDLQCLGGSVSNGRLCGRITARPTWIGELVHLLQITYFRSIQRMKK